VYRNLQAGPDPFLKALAPHHDHLVVVVIHPITRFPRGRSLCLTAAWSHVPRHRRGSMMAARARRSVMRLFSGSSPQQRYYASATLLRAKSLWLA
jgi:hypothetical protein